jgi:hypothetical protein
MTRYVPALLSALLLLALPAAASAHVPSVAEGDHASPDSALVLEDPTLSRAIGATIGAPGEVDWYVMELAAGDPLLVGMSAPDAVGMLAATFAILGPGLPDATVAGEPAVSLASQAGAEGALVLEPLSEPVREIHGGLPFLDQGGISTQAPADGRYWIAVWAVDPEATGKYVLAPGVREEFGLDAIGGMVDLVAFFDAPWPPETVDSQPRGEDSP